MRNINCQRVLSLVRNTACALALFTLALFSLNLPAKADVNLTTSVDAAALVNAIVGSNSNVVLTGTPVLNAGNSAISTGTFTTVNSNLGLARGFALSTGYLKEIINGVPGPGSGISDSATQEFNIVTLTFSFIPKAEVYSVSFNSVFTSREYEPTFDPHDDNFTILLSGGTYNNTNVATIPGTTSRVGARTINSSTNARYYRDNGALPPPLPDIVLPGASTVLTHSFAVVPGTTYTATIRIADDKDANWHSDVLIGPIPNLQLDLSAAGQGTGYMTTWNSPGPAVIIAGSDVVIKQDNIPGNATTLSSATLTISNPARGDLLLVTGRLPRGITASAYDPTTGAITLSGTATYAAYQTALAQVSYNTTATHPTGPVKTVNVVVYDGTIASNTAVTTINIIFPYLEITKIYTLPPASNGMAKLGDIITYSYQVTNTGTVPMSHVTVEDMHGSPPVKVLVGADGIGHESLLTSGPAGPDASRDVTPDDGIWDALAPGASVTFTWDHTVTQAEVEHG